MAGSIPQLSASMGLVLSWVATRIDPILGNRTDSNNLSLTLQFQNALNAAFPANQCAVLPIKLTAGQTLTTDLSQPISNVIEDVTATFDRLFGVIAWLPSMAQSSSLGCAASSVKFGKAATKPALILGLTDNNSAYILNNGDARGWLTPRPHGYPISPVSKNLQVVNQDGSNPGTLYLGLIGLDYAYGQVDFSNPNQSFYIAAVR